MRQQRSTIRNEAEMIDAYEKEISKEHGKKYNGKGEELKKRLRELGLLFSGNKSEKCIRLASYIYKKRMPLSEA